jgi:sodium-dependent dicarboxylate transporter 2/3/5
MGTGERRVVVVFAVVVLGWLLRPFVLEPLVPGITDTAVALVGGVLVFLVPVDLRRGEFLLDWEYTTRVPWGVLLLFGAGFSLAEAFQLSGLDRWLADLLTGLGGVELVWILLAVAAFVVFLTEVTSNTATASLFVPVAVSLAASLFVSPLVLMVTVAVAASFAFMLPVATPPNAIVFGSGYLSIPQMARVGFWLNLLGILYLTAMTYVWLPVVWGL